MKTMDENNPYQKMLIKLLNSIDNQIPLKAEDKVLMVLSLNSEEKIVEYSRWVKSKLDGERLNATYTEIVQAAVWIGKGLSPEDREATKKNSAGKPTSNI